MHDRGEVFRNEEDSHSACLRGRKSFLNVALRCNPVKLSVVIPVYNEKDTLQELLRRVERVKLPLEKEIIVVDDFSTDGSREMVSMLPNRFLKILQPQNRGKGAALKAGIAVSSGEFIIFQDADLEYNPEDFTTLLQPVLRGETDMVFGSRFTDQHLALFGKERTMHLTHWAGNKALTLIFNTLYHTGLTDVEPCYKLFRSEVLRSVSVSADRFEYDIELMCKLVRKGYRVRQLPIRYAPRSFTEGKKISWKDGLVALRTMLQCRFSAV